MNSAFPTNIAKSKGFSLIEILVSLVVLSIGMMGLGGLQLAALKGSNDAHYRTEASLLMMDLADRMRANLEGVSEGRYRIEPTNPVNCSVGPARQCDASNCNGEQMASFDKYTIVCGEGGLKASLPGSELTINCASNDCNASDEGLGQELNKTHNIIVSWKEAKTKKEDMSDGQDFKVKTISLSIVP